MKNDIQKLRDVARWVDHQNEDWWLPEDGNNPTIPQIVELFDLCAKWGVESPEELWNQEDGDDPKAERELNDWIEQKVKA